MQKKNNKSQLTVPASVKTAFEIPVERVQTMAKEYLGRHLNKVELERFDFGMGENYRIARLIDRACIYAIEMATDGDFWSDEEEEE